MFMKQRIILPVGTSVDTSHYEGIGDVTFNDYTFADNTQVWTTHVYKNADQQPDEDSDPLTVVVAIVGPNGLYDFPPPELHERRQKRLMSLLQSLNWVACKDELVLEPSL